MLRPLWAISWSTGGAGGSSITGCDSSLPPEGSFLLAVIYLSPSLSLSFLYNICKFLMKNIVYKLLLCFPLILLIWLFNFNKFLKFIRTFGTSFSRIISYYTIVQFFLMFFILRIKVYIKFRFFIIITLYERSSKFKSLLLLFAVLFQVASSWDAKSKHCLELWTSILDDKRQSNSNNSKDLLS